MDIEPNFSEYSYQELLDAKKHIDQGKYPQRYATVVGFLDKATQTQKGKIEKLEQVEIDKYSTFWPRFWAATIDGIIFVVVIYTECLIFNIEYNAQDKYLQAFNGLQLAIYSVFMHGYFGQTFGKMIMNVIVLDYNTDSQINVSQAFRRESVNLFLNLSWFAIVLIVTRTLEHTSTLSATMSYTLIIFGVLAVAWGISEFVTMLFNDKRRAIHDYIGNTVVVCT